MTSIDEVRADQRARFLSARNGDPFAHADVVAAAAVLDAGFGWPDVMPLRVERNDERALVARRIADAGLADPALRKKARAFLREERFYVELAAFADVDDAAYVLTEARAAVDSGAGDDVTTAAVRALPAFADVAFGARLSFGPRIKPTPMPGATPVAVSEAVVAVLIAGLFSENTIVIPGAARALAALGASSTKDALRAALGRLRADAEHGYEERQALGVVALALVALAGKSAANEVKSALAVVASDEDTAHFAQLNAASWLALGDVAAARAFLDRRSGLAWAAAALADLGAVDAIADLEKARATLTAPATALAFDEALRRLRAKSGVTTSLRAVADALDDESLEGALGSAFDNALAAASDAAAPAPVNGASSARLAPAAPDLVWSLGSMHPGEIALGVDSDNVFELAAAVTPPSVVEADAGLARDR